MPSMRGKAPPVRPEAPAGYCHDNLTTWRRETDVSATYSDRWIDLTDDGIVIRGYYIPWGTKRIPYSAIRHVTRVDLGLINGRARIWGTANPGVWASLDPRRPSKRVGFLIDHGRGITPLITPDDPDAVHAALRARLPAGVVASGSRRAPIV
jgi:hypothetical protein